MAHGNKIDGDKIDKGRINEGRINEVVEAAVPNAADRDALLAWARAYGAKEPPLQVP